MTATTGNRILAARAADLARQADPGSHARKVAGVVAVALAETRTLRAARAVLAGWDDGPQDIRQGALALLGELATEPNGDTP